MEAFMKIGQQLKIKQNQSLIMTPQLQQAIKLLQLSNIELAEFVEDARAENPFINDDFSSRKIANTEEITKDVSKDLKNISDEIKSKVEIENCFDTHISENNSYLEEKVYNKSNSFLENNYSSTEVIENTKENKISLQQFIINQIKLEFDEKQPKTIENIKNC